MKKLLLIISGFILIESAEGQNPTYQQKLYYSCKVWGFVKYFHSRVSACEVNWDSVLIADLPLVKNAVTKNDFNNALDTMLNAAGPMALTTSPPCDTMPPELKRNLNTAWINDTSVFRNDIITLLDTINNNFRPHSECSVELNPNEGDGGYLKFISGDSLILNINDYTNYADEWHRLLEVFVHWNIINYFNPYNYVHDEPWDSALYQNIMGIDNATNDQQFYYGLRKITSQNDDAHTEGLTWDDYCNFPGGYTGWYSPLLILKYIPNQYVVVKSGVTGISNGDAIVSINGLTTRQWEDSLRSYISAGDTAVFRRTVSSYMLYGNYRAPMTIEYTDSLNNNHTTTAYCDSLFYDDWFYSYYPNDTLANVQWKYWSNCNIGYVNVGEMEDSGYDVYNMYSALQYTNAIIFDIRNYPVSGAVWDLVNSYMYAVPTYYAKFQAPDVTYPGTYTWDSLYMGYYGNPGYSGKIIILFNEETQSAAENCCMILGAMPDVVKIGSQTAGTDGNVTYFLLNDYTQTGFTTLGWFYPNGDSTERVGIIPDIIDYPTQAGIRAGRDEVLEKALEVAGCPLSVPDIQKPIPVVESYPNPASTEITFKISSGENRYLKIIDITGREIETLPVLNNERKVNISEFPSGIYFYEILDNSATITGRGKFSVVK